MACAIFVCNVGIVVLASSNRLRALLLSLFFAVQLQTFLGRLEGQEGQEKRQQALDVDRGERL